MCYAHSLLERLRFRLEPRWDMIDKVTTKVIFALPFRQDHSDAIKIICVHHF